MKLFLSSRYGILLLLSVAILFIPGCGGCTGGSQAGKTPEEIAEEKKQKEKEEEEKKKNQKPDFKIDELIVKPNDIGTVDESKPDQASNVSKIGYVKAGHWTTGSLQMIANNFDFKGNLISRCMDSSQKQIPTQGTSYMLTISRPISLPKGQTKEVEVNYFVPARPAMASFVGLNHELQTTGGRTIYLNQQGGTLIPDYQYYMVVLSTTAAGYRYLEMLDSVKTTHTDDRTLQYYRVAYPNVTQRVSLPEHSLNWTSIAYLIWDDLDPGLLVPDQKQAMLDWLHFGGQLIINGPDGFSKLKNSFLKDFLPAESAEVRNLSSADFDQLNDHWSIPLRNKSLSTNLAVTDETKVLGAEMQLADDARFIQGTGNLVAERQVGRGRIVMTGFSMKNRQVINWKSWDGFFNSCILRRPARRFYEDSQSTEVQFDWINSHRSKEDPMLSTTLRYLSRDLGAYNESASVDPLEGESDSLKTAVGQATSKDENTSTEKDDAWHYGGYRSHPQSGVAGWNDHSGVSAAARAVLQESAGINPPSSDFVLKVLFWYLMVLVPGNWLFFRLIGKLEWAWAAAPLIAIIGGIVVVRMASLDIGFARSRTEIGVLEMRGDFARGHLTRYTALYTSLSSEYELSFEQGDSQAQPFAHGADVGAKFTEVRFRREKDWKLQSYRIQSNSTSIVHSEQMIDTGGPIQLTTDSSGQFLISNNSKFALLDAGLLRRDKNGVLKKCWIGQLSADSGPQKIDWQRGDDQQVRFEQWNRSRTSESVPSIAQRMFQEHDADTDGFLTRMEIQDLPNVLRVFQDVDGNQAAQSNHETGNVDGPDERLSLPEFEKCLLLSGASDDISLGIMFEMVSNNLKLSPGETRLVAWTSTEMPDMKIDPVSTQNTQKTFVVVHLQPGSLPAPTRDLNSKYEYISSDVLKDLKIDGDVKEESTTGFQEQQ